MLSRHQQVSRADSERPASESVIGCDRESSTAERRLSFPAEDEVLGGFLGPGDSLEDLEFLKKSEKELTHFSEEGIADMDIPDHLLEELDFLDNITSCDKVENYLMLSEYEQNLIKEIEGPEGVSVNPNHGKDADQLMLQVRGKRGRKWSLVRQGSSMQGEQRPLTNIFF